MKEEYILELLEISEKLKLENINIDYFPTNFVVEEDEMIYIDYEFNQYSEEWNFENWGIYYWVNQEGMKNFLETGDYSKINIDKDSGKPIKEPFTGIVENILKEYTQEKKHKH